MKLSLTKTFLNYNLLLAEVTGRSESQQRLERIAVAIITIICVAPILSVLLVAMNLKTIQTENKVIISHKSQPRAMVIDEGWVKDENERYLEYRPIH